MDLSTPNQHYVTPTPPVDALEGSSTSQESSRRGETEDSGYCSETSTNDVEAQQESDDTSDDNDLFFTDDDDFEDIDDRIDYIRAKQTILQRASILLCRDAQEDSYTAHELLMNQKRLGGDKTGNHGLVQDVILPLSAALPGILEEITANPTIWEEAKTVLEDIMNQKAGDTTNNSAKRAAAKGRSGTSTAAAAAATKCGPRTFKRPHPLSIKSPRSTAINISTVSRMTSANYDAPAAHGFGGTLQQQQVTFATLPSATFKEGQWMAQALIRSSPAQIGTSTRNDIQDCRWKVISDPVTCSLGLVPPSSISMQNAIGIEDALAFTSQAKLVTQATPPFCVVFANKAFLYLAGLVSKDSLIGMPVESIITVQDAYFGCHHDANTTPSDSEASLFPQDGGYNNKGDSDYIPCQVSTTDTACLMKVIPVLDRFQRRRLSRSSYSCMSHLMIELHQEDTAVSDVTSEDDDLLYRPLHSPASPPFEENEDAWNQHKTQQDHQGRGGGNHQKALAPDSPQGRASFGTIG